MNTKFLQDHVVRVLGHQKMTSDDLLVQLNIDNQIRKLKLGLPRLRSILREMVNVGTVEKAYGKLRDQRPVYFVPPDAYIAEYGGTTWHVVKYDEGRFNGTILGGNFSEDEARVCAAALNKRERDGRSR
jgi:hypothetical protein